MHNVGPFLQGPLRLAWNMRGLHRLWLAHSKAVHVNTRCCLLLLATCTVLHLHAVLHYPVAYRS